MSLGNHRIINSYQNIYDDNNGYNKQRTNNARVQQGIDIIGKWGTVLSKGRNNNYQEYLQEANGYRFIDNNNNYVSNSLKINIEGAGVASTVETNIVNGRLSGTIKRNVLCDYVRCNGNNFFSKTPINIMVRYLIKEIRNNNNQANNQNGLLNIIYRFINPIVDV